MAAFRAVALIARRLVSFLSFGRGKRSPMSFNHFLAAIESPKLQRIAMHWEAARGKKRMPGWSDIDPAAIGADLTIVWSWKYDRAAESFTGRLAGEDINEAFGESLRGKRMEDFFPPSQYPMILARHKRIVIEPAFAHGRGRVFIHAERFGQGERIIMPLASDGVRGDGIFGATIYEMEPRPPAGAAGPRYVDAEQVDFYSLD
jgi:hypothetical protein